jgi:hypothetical protein
MPAENCESFLLRSLPAVAGKLAPKNFQEIKVLPIFHCSQIENRQSAIANP